MTDETITENILKQAQAKIDEALDSQTLSKSERAMLEGQNYVLMFLRDDHKKINEIYPFFVAEKEAKKNKDDNDRFIRRQVLSTAIASLVMLTINVIIVIANLRVPTP